MSEYRDLSFEEQRLLERLLEMQFAGRDELLSQLASCLAREVDDNGSLELVSHAGERRADVRSRVPVEAEYEDADGVTVHLLLHVVEGKLGELEVYREDGGAVQRRASPSQLRVVSLPAPPQ